MKQPHFYHYATEGLKDDFLFGSPVEFIAGINRIALCLCRLGPDHPVQVICFVLMDNHVHFILYGLEEDCDLFMARYKAATEIWLRRHGDGNGPGKLWRIGHWSIPDRDRLRATITYIHRNPMAAGMALSPAGYRWSSASLLFTDNNWIRAYGKRVDSFGANARERLFNSKTELPGDWIVLPDGEIAARVRSMAEKKYGEQRIRFLNVNQRMSLARILRKETGTTVKQIARAVHLRQEEIEPILNPRKG